MGNPAIADSDESTRKELAAGVSTSQFDEFLDHLMRAESGGRDWAANPRSTALGPFQFIKSTFIELARRHFAKEVAGKSEEDLLALRTDRAFARRAAAVYTMENFAYLSSQGLKPTFGDLRLAYLVGPGGAARLLQASPATPAVDILGTSVVKANPFMNGMSASDLIARSARDVGEQRARVAAAPEPRARPVGVQPSPHVQPRPTAKTEIAVKCNRKLVACRRWVAMQANKQRVAQQAPSRSAAARKAAGRGRISVKNDNGPGV